jgi:hypothetical protein
LIAVLPVEVENVFDGLEVAVFVLISGGIFDVVEIKPVFTGSCDSSAGIGAGSLVAVVSVSVCLFSPQIVSPSALSNMDSRFYSVTNSARAASGIVLSSRYSVRTAR